MASKIGMQRCAASSQWLNERISLSRYAHVRFLILWLVQFLNDFECLVILMVQVPLGNFELDWLMHTADIFFSRALRDQQQVVSGFLYYSPISQLLEIVFTNVLELKLKFSSP